ncbi:MAG: methionyl-tRNA formyltransferase [Firmicutes bacterium]|nr:methionyl-tRNA formyltransferase [Bacillota bacterium]
MNKELKIIYMGTPEFAVAPLEALIENNYNVVLAVTQPDKARDRGKKIRPTPVKETAVNAGIEVLQPDKIKKNEDFLSVISKIEPDIIIVAAYGKILPVSLLEIPRFGCVNIHASLLPKFRGAAPIQRSIIEGEEKTGVTLMYMAEGLDTGDMIAKSETEIGKKTADDLHDELSVMGAKLLIEYLPKISSGNIIPEKQDDSLACYAPMITKSEGKIDFSRRADEIERLIRGLTPWPGAFTDYNGLQMKIRAAEVSDMTSEADFGTVIDVDKQHIYVACKDSVLAVSAVQMPGKKAMPVSDYLKGNKIEKGTVLGG